MLFTALILSLSLFTFTAAADEGGQSGADDVAEGRAMIRAGMRDLIEIELQLTDAEKDEFWPVYDAYEKDARPINDRYATMLTEYVKRYNAGDLSDDYAADLLANYFAIKKETLKVREAYIPKFKAVLPTLKVAQFYQLENKINAEIDYQLAANIPLISE